MLIGFVGQDPVLKHLESNHSVCNLRVATSEQYIKDGIKHETMEWHDICCFDSLAESVAKGTRKGRQVYVEGKIRTRNWETDSGEKRSTKDILAFNVQFLGTLKDIKENTKETKNE
jgi:single-strand DNA-binding protein